MRSAVSGVRCAECGVRCAECGMRCAVCGVLRENQSISTPTREGNFRSSPVGKSTGETYKHNTIKYDRITRNVPRDAIIKKKKDS